MRFRIVASALLPLVTAGCIHFRSEPIDPARRAAVLTSRSLGNKNWTVEGLTRQAVATSPEIAVARAEYRAARAAIGTAGERPNPTVAFTPQVVTPFTKWIEGTYGVDFDWTFETAGKRARRIEVAGEQSRAAAARVIDATWKVRASTRKALLDLYAAEQKAMLINDAAKMQGDVVHLIEERINAGAASILETAQPRLLAAQLRLQGSDAAKATATARAALAESLTMGVNGLSGVKFSFAEFERVPGKVPLNRKAALTHRADILAALADYAAAEAALRLEVAKQYPDIHLNPGYQLDAGENKWALGVGLTLPILNQNRGAIHEAEAKRKVASAKFDAVQAKALADVERALAGVSSARAKLATTNGLLEEQDRQIQSLNRIIAAGEGDKLALFSAQVERATTRLGRLDALVELHAALGALEEATQTPLER